MQTPTKSTPRSRKSISSADSPRSPFLSPVAVSPGRSPSQGNLTGSARKVKDGVADWHNYIDKWNTHNSTGTKLIKDIANIKLEAVYSSEHELEFRDSEHRRCEMPADMDILCQSLTIIIKSMKKILNKFETLTVMLNGVCELEKHQNQGSWDPEPLFQTWPIWKFYETSQELYTMYMKELQLKQTICENVAHTKDRDLLLFYTTCWIHQPYIQDRATFLMESMLVETGHRKRHPHT